MNRKILAASFVSLCLAMGCATLESPKGAVKATPVITHSFASGEMRVGDSWKIYLNASDPDGEMIRIFATVEQAGRSYPVSIRRVSKENGKEFSGYLYLSTTSSESALDGLSITLRIQIQDRSGEFSQPVVFPLVLSSLATQQAPPQGIFKEQNLGPIMVTLKGVYKMGRSRDDFTNYLSKSFILLIRSSNFYTDQRFLDRTSVASNQEFFLDFQFLPFNASFQTEVSNLALYIKAIFKGSFPFTA